MNFVARLIQKVNLHHHTRLSQVSREISHLMMISSTACHFTPLTNPGIVKGTVSILATISTAITLMLKASNSWIYLSALFLDWEIEYK